MRPVAIAFAALSALAIPAAVQAAPAGQMFAQGGTSPAVGGNGQSGNPEIGPNSKPTYPPTKSTSTTHHRRRHYAARTTTSTPATPSSSSTTPMPDAGK